MSKLLVVTFSNGESYGIPAEYVARVRGEYYAGVDIAAGDDDGMSSSQIVELEVAHALKDTYEVVDWADNNMDWADFVQGGVRRLDAGRCLDYEAEFPNAHKQVVETHA